MSAPIYIGQRADASDGGGPSSWYLDLIARATGSGVIVASMPTVSATDVWVLDRVIVTCTSGTSTTCRLHDGPTTELATVLDISLAGNLDVAEYPSKLIIAPGRTLAARWAAAQSGSTCTLRAIGRRLVTGGTIP